MLSPKFTHPILIYLPCYNCATTVANVVRSLPPELKGVAEALIIDNCSPDNTGRVAAAELAQQPGPIPCRVIRTRRNLGYAGSQKLAYEIALAQPAIENVVMLHGDAQYPPELIGRFLPLRAAGYDIAYGYRSKTRYWGLEETPLPTFAIIRLLSIIESLVTMTFRKEWHTGFIMYSTSFLAKVPLQSLTDTPHIDGHLLYAGGQFGARVKGVPIFKRYKDLVAFSGVERAKYVIHVFKLMFSFRSIRLLTIPPVKIFTANDIELIEGAAQ